MREVPSSRGFLATFMSCPWMPFSSASSMSTSCVPFRLYILTFVYILTYIHTYIFMYIYGSIYIHIYLHNNMYMYIYMHTCM